MKFITVTTLSLVMSAVVVVAAVNTKSVASTKARGVMIEHDSIEHGGGRRLKGGSKKGDKGASEKDDATKDSKMAKSSKAEPAAEDEPSVTSISTSLASRSSPVCRIDPVILNEKSLPKMEDIALSFFAAACGKNRGAFVVDPPDGHTYGCLVLPKNVGELAGLPDLKLKVKDANAIRDLYVTKNTTAAETLALLEFVIENVYKSTPNKAGDVYACDINGLAELDCGGLSRSPRTDGEPLRSVSLAGLFVSAPWATSGHVLTLSEAAGWYTADDFDDMAKLGLNTVQIDVPTAAFIKNDLKGEQILEVLTDVLKMVDASGLQVILRLVATGDQLDAVVAAAEYVATLPVILALTLPKNMMLDMKEVVHSMRTVAPELPLFLPLSEGDLVKIDGGDFDKNVYGSLDVSHIGTIADIASSSSQEDRSKMFYHESVSCIKRSPSEYSNCFHDMPIFWGEGFDLSIDDCINQKMEGSNFKDYGQCDRFDESTDSPWWLNHRSSFAARQLYAAERGLGWSFATWKLLKNDKVGVMDRPEKLLALQDVVAAGMFPKLTGVKIPAHDACLNPPVNDFALGDATLAPSLGPPPDCGNGWWNFETEKCDYWIPPTPSPTEPCPDCNDVCSTGNATLLGSFSTSDGGTSTVSLVLAGLCGAAIVLVIVAIVKLCGRTKRHEYASIPN